MHTKIKLFVIIVMIGFAISVLRFSKTGEWPLILFVSPIFGLYMAIAMERYLNSKDHSSWIYKIPKMLELKEALNTGLSINPLLYFIFLIILIGLSFLGLSISGRFTGI